MNLIVFLIISITFLSTVEIIKRKFLLSSNITRRVSHIGASLIAASSALFIDKNLIVLACFGFVGLMFISRKFNFFSSIHNVNRISLGELFLPLGEAFSAVIFLPQSVVAFQFGVLVMGLSDAFAGFIGEKYGRHKINFFHNGKTLEGSLAFFFTSVFLTFIFIHSFGFYLIWIPLTLTLTELLLGYGSDNLVIPIFASYLFSILL